jgi:hypothetical protein
VAITCAAPVERRPAALSAGPRCRAIDTEPAQLASWIAAMPTLDEAARTITPSPMPTLATSMIA